MNKPTILLLPFASLLFASCGGSRGENFDTAPAPAYDQPGPAAASVPANPTYDTAAYEENTPVPAPVEATPAAPIPTPAAPLGNLAADGTRVHYIAPGDSLSKISSIYKVPIDSIKAANNMTSDIVVLGKKLIIPAK